MVILATITTFPIGEKGQNWTKKDNNMIKFPLVQGTEDDLKIME